MSRILQYTIALAMVAVFILVAGRRPEAPRQKPDFKQASSRYAPLDKVAPNSFRKFAWLNGWWRIRIGDEKKSHPVAVPGSWNTIPGLENYNGPVEYSVMFKVPADWKDGRHVIHFGAVPGHVRVWVNGKTAGEYFNSYLPFEADVTGLVVPGGNNMLLVSIEPLPEGAIETDEKFYGGILREVYMEQRQSLMFRDIKVETQSIKAATATLMVSALIDVPDMDNVHLFGEIEREVGKPVAFDRVVSPQGEKRITVNFKLTLGEADLWSPSNPALYTVNLIGIHENGIADGISRRFGVRVVEFRNGNLLVNGIKTPLRGVTLRRQAGFGWGPIDTEKQMKDDLSRIASTGFNAVRLTTPAHPAFLDMCDAAGMMVFEELPLSGADSNNAFFKNEVRKFASRDRHHPSIIAWGVSTADNALSDKSAHALVGQIKKLDSSKSVYVNRKSETIVLASDDELQVVAWNDENPRKANSFFGKTKKALERAGKDTFVLLSAGATGSPRRPERAGLLGSETNQLYVIRAIESGLEKEPSAAGWFYDSYADYYGRGVTPRGGSALLEKGLVSLDREPKLAFEHLSGLADSDPKPVWSRFPYMTSKTELAALLLIAVLCAGLWYGTGRAASVLVEPDLVWSIDGSTRSILEGLGLFGAPLLLAGAFAAAFAFSPAHDAATLGRLSGAAIGGADYALVFLSSPAGRAMFFLAAQAGLLAAAALVASLFLGNEPVAVFEIFARCLPARILFVLIPFLPFPAAVIVGAVLLWEGFLQSGALSRGFGISPAQAVFLVAFSQISALIFGALVFIHRFGPSFMRLIV